MARENLYVIDRGQKVPFLRGMITHSLIERGLSFHEAYETASKVRDKIRSRHTVSKSELSKIIEQVVSERYGQRYARRRVSRVRQLPAVLVTGADRTDRIAPFSKGILSQSLQATGLEPPIAYDIGREIEGRLLQEKKKEISRDDLRRLIYETIHARHGPEIAERYLLWRCFKAPDKPLLILFGGATGVGKSTLAAEVAHRLGIQKLVSTDTIRQIMRMMFSQDLLPAIHYSSYEAWKERTIRASEGHQQAVISGFREQAVKVLVGVRAMVERAIQENSSLVIDGVHLVPGLTGLEQFENRVHDVQIIVSTLDRQKYLERFPRRETREGLRVTQRYWDNFENILQIQDYVLDMAENHDVPIVENDNFDQTVSSILTVVTNTLREKLNLDQQKLVSQML